eukprot:Rmarinus@m.28070
MASEGDEFSDFQDACSSLVASSSREFSVMNPEHTAGLTDEEEDLCTGARSPVTQEDSRARFSTLSLVQQNSFDSIEKKVSKEFLVDSGNPNRRIGRAVVQADGLANNKITRTYHKAPGFMKGNADVILGMNMGVTSRRLDIQMLQDAMTSDAPAMQPRVQYLAAIPVLSPWPRPALARVAAALTPVAVPKHSYLFREGDDSSYIYFLVEGTIRLLLRMPVRKRAVPRGFIHRPVRQSAEVTVQLEVTGRQEVLGVDVLLADLPTDYDNVKMYPKRRLSAEAVSECQLLRISVRDLLRVVHKETLDINQLKLMAAHRMRTLQHAADNLKQVTDRRIPSISYKTHVSDQHASDDHHRPEHETSGPVWDTCIQGDFEKHPNVSTPVCQPTTPTPRPDPRMRNTPTSHAPKTELRDHLSGVAMAVSVPADVRESIVCSQRLPRGRRSGSRSKPAPPPVRPLDFGSPLCRRVTSNSPQSARASSPIRCVTNSELIRPPRSARYWRTHALQNEPHHGLLDRVLRSDTESHKENDMSDYQASRKCWWSATSQDEATCRDSLRRAQGQTSWRDSDETSHCDRADKSNATSRHHHEETASVGTESSFLSMGRVALDEAIQVSRLFHGELSLQEQSLRPKPPDNLFVIPSRLVTPGVGDSGSSTGRQVTSEAVLRPDQLRSMQRIAQRKMERAKKATSGAGPDARITHKPKAGHMATTPLGDNYGPDEALEGGASYPTSGGSSREWGCAEASQERNHHTRPRVPRTKSFGSAEVDASGSHVVPRAPSSSSSSRPRPAFLFRDLAKPRVFENLRQIQEQHALLPSARRALRDLWRDHDSTPSDMRRTPTTAEKIQAESFAGLSTVRSALDDSSSPPPRETSPEGGTRQWGVVCAGKGFISSSISLTKIRPRRQSLPLEDAKWADVPDSSVLRPQSPQPEREFFTSDGITVAVLDTTSSSRLSQEGSLGASPMQSEVMRSPQVAEGPMNARLGHVSNEGVNGAGTWSTVLPGVA